MPQPKPFEATDWHTRTVADAEQQLATGPAGLSVEQAFQRLAEYGPNELEAGQRISAWKILLEQFQNVLLVILLIATGLSVFLGHWTESLVIGAIVLFAVGLGFIQEYRAERAMEALREMAAPHARS